MKTENGKLKAEDGRVKGDLKKRTKDFALKIVSLYSDLPRRREAQVIGDQLLRSGTSVGAHFREAQRAKSNPDFISKIEGGTQELEETVCWLELLDETGLCAQDKLESLRKEADELMRSSSRSWRFCASKGRARVAGEPRLHGHVGIFS